MAGQERAYLAEFLFEKGNINHGINSRVFPFNTDLTDYWLQRRYNITFNLYNVMVENTHQATAKGPSGECTGTSGSAVL